MDYKQMIEKFATLAETAIGSPDTMGVLKASAGKMFTYLTERDPRKAEEMLSELEQIHYNNYLTYDEAKNIMADFVNYDGSKGAKWSCAEIEKFLTGKGIATEQSPYYNSYALAVAMNRIYSDYGGEIKDLTDDEAVACYNFALRDLKDPDRPRWIREYFEKSLDE